MKTIDLSAEFSVNLFKQALEHDQGLLADQPWLTRWLFADLLAARKQRTEMSFYDYEGVAHLRKFFAWIQAGNYADYFPDERMRELSDRSAARDTACAKFLGVEIPQAWIHAVGRYNAQDYVLQRFYPVPPAQQVRVLLDFGAGHGRMANLGLSGARSLKRLIAVDAIPGTYLVQRAYYAGLQLRVADYIDCEPSQSVYSVAEETASDLIHLPTWRLDLVPDCSVDMVCCVQVLKELPRRLLVWVLQHFSRVLKPGGALYIRDHIQFHNPGQMPVDDIVATMGFVLEFRPQVRDRDAIHGLPRIWRKFDPENFFKEGD